MRRRRRRREGRGRWGGCTAGRWPGGARRVAVAAAASAPRRRQNRPCSDGQSHSSGAPYPRGCRRPPPRAASHMASPQLSPPLSPPHPAARGPRCRCAARAQSRRDRCQLARDRGRIGSASRAQARRRRAPRGPSRWWRRVPRAPPARTLLHLPPRGCRHRRRRRRPPPGRRRRPRPRRRRRRAARHRGRPCPTAAAAAVWVGVTAV